MMSAAFDSKSGSSLLDPVLPLSPGRAERHGFEYYRHGTLSLYAALDTQSGKVLDKTAARYTSQEFVEFLTEVVERPPAREVHNILDNLSAHKSQVVRDFLATHLNVHFHFTPTYSSWLNQVEIWFSKLERDVIARGIFGSVKDLARKLRRYINASSANAKPIQWRYSDPTPASAVTVSLPRVTTGSQIVIVMRYVSRS
jgi:transposase